MRELVGQLADELAAAAWRWTGIAPLDTVNELTAVALSRVDYLAALLTDESDDRALAETVQSVMHLLWPTGDPDPEWWQTPLGHHCARSLGTIEDGEAVTHSVAAAMLGVHRGTVAQLVARGTLDRHPDGGVLRSSVLRRIGR